MKKVLYITILACSTLWGSCTEKNKQSARTDSFIEKNVAFARAQIGNEIQIIEKSEKFINPVTLKTDSTIYYCDYADWRSGFFPGSVWYLYELSGDTTLLSLADKYTSAIEEAKKLTWHHDVGFMINCSFGNGWRTTKVPKYKEVMIEASIMTSLYLGTLVVRHPLPKLQFIMKPTSWCQVSFLASSMAEVYLSANDKRVVSPLNSYRYHTDPGKKPLRQSA